MPHDSSHSVSVTRLTRRGLLPKLSETKIGDLSCVQARPSREPQKRQGASRGGGVAARRQADALMQTIPSFASLPELRVERQRSDLAPPILRLAVHRWRFRILIVLLFAGYLKRLR